MTPAQFGAQFSAQTPAQIGAHRGRATRMVVGDGRIWSVLADQLLLEIRAALGDGPRHLRLGVPWVVSGPLDPRATGRYAYTLGARELQPVTLPQIIERFVDVGGQVDVLTRSDAPQAEMVAS